jgi:hypothetical protein
MLNSPPNPNTGNDNGKKVNFQSLLKFILITYKGNSKSEGSLLFIVFFTTEGTQEHI